MESNLSEFVKTKNQVEDLEKAFEARKKSFTNRASCVFPIYLKANTDLHIVFLNYWSLKSNILSNNITINFRIYTNDGHLIKLESIKTLHDHNQYSIKKILCPENDTSVFEFNGSIHIEIVSIDNLKFPFPGIVGIYQANDLYSVVHAAGRVKNTDELQKVSYTQETNWTCKFGENITPFFHFFNGPSVPIKKNITVTLRSANGEILSEKEIAIDHLPPFASQLYFIEDIFKNTEFKNGYFVSVTVEHNSIYPRLVVGNLFKDLNFLEVTHSFPLIEQPDYCPVNQNVSFQSMLCGHTSNDLNLTFNVFPTNCEGKMNSEILHQTFSDNHLVKKQQSNQDLTNISSASGSYELEDLERFIVIRMKGDTVPSRINGSFIYKVKNTPTLFSTDIASGAKSSVYPPKYRHWGHAYTMDGFDTTILIRNNSHNPEETKLGKGTLTLYSFDLKKDFKFEIEPESAKSIQISTIISTLPTPDIQGPQFLSWMIEMDVPTCETFWVAYRKKDGAIFGEHGF